MQFWDLFQWWNLVFTLPFGVGLLPLLLQAAGAAHFGHGGHAVHLGQHHVPHASGHHLPHLEHAQVAAHGHVAPPAHGTTPHTEATAGTHSHPETPARLLGILGIGKVPIMLVFSIFCTIWGVTGVAANAFFSKILRAPAVYVW